MLAEFPCVVVLVDQTQKITEEISGENQIQGNDNGSGSEHEGSSVHSDNWHVVSRSTGSIKAPALLQTSKSGNQNQTVASSEETLNLFSERQFQSVSLEQHTDTVFSSNQTRAVSSEHTSSQQTYTASSGETRVVLPE